MSKLSHNKLAAKEQVLEQFHSGMSLLAGRLWLRGLSHPAV